MNGEIVISGIVIGMALILLIMLLGHPARNENEKWMYIIKLVGISVGVSATVVICAIALFSFCLSSDVTPEITELTIEHLWQDENEYYFSDEMGHVYLLEDNIPSTKITEMFAYKEILYEDMPKQRFKKLEEGGIYECTYYLHGRGGMRLSIGEKEMEE